MSLVDRDALSHRRLSRIFIAATLREARRAEHVLTERGVDYVVEVEPFQASLFFGPRNGAAFYVSEDQAEYCRLHLANADLTRGVLHEPDEDIDTGSMNGEQSRGG